MNSGRFRFPPTLPRKVESGFIRQEPMNHKSLQHRKLAKVHKHEHCLEYETTACTAGRLARCSTLQESAHITPLHGPEQAWSPITIRLDPRRNAAVCSTTAAGL